MSIENRYEELPKREITLGPTGDVQELEEAISARLNASETPVQVVWVSEAALARDFDAQGPGEFEGQRGPTAGREPDARAVKAWLARVCRTHGLSCSYDAASRSYAFRRIRHNPDAPS